MINHEADGLALHNTSMKHLKIYPLVAQGPYHVRLESFKTSASISWSLRAVIPHVSFVLLKSEELCASPTAKLHKD
jgi:hypothetical protein